MGLEFVNQFIICSETLEAKDEGSTVGTLIEFFLDRSWMTIITW